MNAPNDNTAAKGLRGWWLSPPRPGMQRLISPWEYRHLRVSGVTRAAAGGFQLGIGLVLLSLGRSAGNRPGAAQNVPVVSLVPGARGGESRGWLLVHRYR
jgi:hypothetical protein